MAFTLYVVTINKPPLCNGYSSIADPIIKRGVTHICDLYSLTSQAEAHVV